MDLALCTIVSVKSLTAGIRAMAASPSRRTTAYRAKARGG
jgi:hypothetical protein